VFGDTSAASTDRLGPSFETIVLSVWRLPGRPSNAHNHGHQVDSHLVEQPQIQALPGDDAAGDCDDTVAGELLSPRDRRLHPDGDEGEGRGRMSIDPVRGD